MTTQRDDDYLICKEYQDRINDVSSEHSDFITFQHPNDNHYFAWVNDGNIVLRSEAYPDADKMQRGIAAIIKNRDLVERYSVDSQHGVHFLVLWGGGDHQKHTGNMESHNEIGRSCPKKTREELHNMLLFKGKDFAQAVVPIDHSVSAPIAETVATVAAAQSFSASEKVTASAPRVEPAAAAVAESAGGFKWWWLLIPLLLLALWWKMCRKDGAAVKDAISTIDTTAQVAKDTIVAAVQGFAKKLTSGFELKGAAKDGIEQQLVTWVEDSTKVVNKDTWFNFDRLLFDTGKSTLQPSSQEQLLNMAEILKAFPKVKIKIGGYTDNVGKPADNLKLSNDRANTIMNELIKLGIDKSRLKAEGYGEQHPVGDNNTEEGRQQNRRIAVRVLEK